jgi:chemotaxis protein histidine kinase CheA
MSKKVAPRIQLNFEPEIVDEPLPEDTISEVEGLPIEVPEVIEREQIVENDIFDNVNPSLNGFNEDIIINEIHEDEPTPKPQVKQTQVKQTQVKQTQVKQKTKRKLSDEHRAKLALAREKALATRRAKAEEKKKMKEIETKTKELKKKKAQKDLEQLEDEVVNDKPVKSTPATVQQNAMFTKKDLEDAQLQAIMNYETIRKARKEEKKKQQMIDQQKKDLQKKIQGYGARDTNGRLLNRWDACY